MRVPIMVIDTNVWLDLLVFRDGACARLASALHQRRVRTAISPGCARELRGVARSPALLARQPQLEQRVTDTIAASIEFDTAAPPGLPVCRDPTDQKFVELAVISSAACLVTKDRALLRLHRRLRPMLVIAPGALLDAWLETHATGGPSSIDVSG